MQASLSRTRLAAGRSACSSPAWAGARPAGGARGAAQEAHALPLHCPHHTTLRAAAPALAGAPCRRAGRLVVSAKKTGSSSSAKGAKQKAVAYGTDWYEATRAAAKPRRTAREEMGERPRSSPALS